MPRILADIIEDARRAVCGHCCADSRAWRAHFPVPDGLHLARFARARLRGLISEAPMAAMLAENGAWAWPILLACADARAPRRQALVPLARVPPTTLGYCRRQWHERCPPLAWTGPWTQRGGQSQRGKCRQCDDPAAAERYSRAGLEIFRSIGHGGGFAVDLAFLLAEALYDQGRFDEARQALDQARVAPHPDKLDATWLTQAKLLARCGQFTAARQHADRAEALLSPASLPLQRADVLEVKAEIERLAGAPSLAAACLRAVIAIYEDLRAIALAEQARTALASLGT